MADAARDSVLAPWQRDFMIGMARAGQAGAAGAGSADSARASSPGDATPADGRWVQQPPPNPRYLHTAIYDPVRDRLVVFGGYTTDYDLVNDVWVLSLAGSPAWTKLTPLGKPPSGRHQHSAIYDPVRNRLVVFGGYERSTVAYLNDTWALSLSDSPRWTQLTPAGTPPSTRFAHSAIYDSQHDRMIVFGGYHSGYRGEGATSLNDVWALSLSDSLAWTELLPDGTSPAARYAHSAIYDSRRHSMVVFGGYSGGFLNDMWALSLSDTQTWTELIPAGAPPAPREYHSAAYDPSGDRMVIFGGLGNGYLGDAWVLALGGGPEWSQLAPAGPQPSGRSGHAAIFDPVRKRMVVYGGNAVGFGLVSQVWALSLDGDATWADLAPGAPPPRRLAHSAIYDPLRDRMVVFGGYDGNSVLNDVWVLSLAGSLSWTPLSPAGTPPAPRAYHTAIYDPVRDRMVVFGGFTQRPDELNDVWALTSSGDPTWTRLNPAGTPPSGREGHTAIYDATNDRMVVFGGVSCCAYLNDVWALSLASNPVWTPLTPLINAPPGMRGYHSAIYDPGRHHMIVFGGLDGTYGLHFLNDVWELSLSDPPEWTRLTPAGPPPRASEGHTAIYDPIGDRMVVFGGFAYDVMGLSNQAWGLSFGAGPAWGLLATAGTPPGPRYLHSAIYDPVRDRMVIFGGNNVQDPWDLSWGREVQLAVSASPGAGGLGPVFAYPNPSRGDVTISFTVRRTSETTVRVFDLAGRVVRTLLSGTLPAGSHSVRWDRRTASGSFAQPGLYLYELRADGQRSARRLVLIR